MFRQDILAGVNGGLVAASFLAAMTSSLLVPWVTSGVSRLLETGLPRIEITLPENESVKISNIVAEDEEVEEVNDKEDIDEMVATNKVRRSIRYQKFLRRP